MLNIELPGRSKRERPQKRFVDVVKEDLQKFGVTSEMEKVRFRQMIHCGGPKREYLKEREEKEGVQQHFSCNKSIIGHKGSHVSLLCVLIPPCATPLIKKTTKNLETPVI